ncbi:MAG TPA: hypothetical protein VN180_09540 [Acidimicrobiia bacterium]|jgi:hypothetical protein|nr:hypothetical protein [Acidimicrobiia bacterium]
MTTSLEALPRRELLPVALDTMLAGMIVTRALLPQVALETGDLDAMNDVAIDEWMGASPVYTGRMRRLMGIEGDRVDAIMKALQLDVGFVHQYMDVGYKILDDDHAEFWLEHCGALLDAEPHGEERVVGMCHTIEDPTFDATALATNPRARIRPLHRPPRRPADRHPHCHWTITIDDAQDPVGAVPLTASVGALALAAVPNRRPDDVEPGGRRDYAAPFDPAFRLADLSHGALVAATREFQVQAHLLICSSDLTLRGRIGDDAAHRMIGDAWVGASWIASERLRRIRPPASPLDALADTFALQPMIPPGFDRDIGRSGDAVRVALRPQVDGLLDADHPGWCGLLAEGDARGIEAMAHGVDATARIAELSLGSDGVSFVATIDPAATPAAEPDVVALARIGMVSGWSFDTTDRVPVADPVRR